MIGLGLADVVEIAAGEARPVIGPAALQRMEAFERFLARLAAERRCIYGVTTGFGPLAGYRLEPGLGAELQRKLIYHLASGVGAPFPPRIARAVMAVRLATLVQGRSAVAPAVAELLSPVSHAIWSPKPVCSRWRWTAARRLRWSTAPR